MFEDLYQKSVEYDDHLLQAACVLQAEFDLDHVDEITQEVRLAIPAVADEYRVSRKDLLRRLKEILEGGE